MRILHVVRQFYPMIGGLENYVFHLAKQQINSGHVVTVLTLNKSFVNNSTYPNKDSISKINIIRIPYFGSHKYPIAISVIKYLKSFDIIHVHAIDFFADFLALTKLLHKKKLILTTHGGFFHTKKNSFLKKIFFNTITRYTLKKYSVIIACSSNDFNTFSKISKNVTLINNGVDVEKYSIIPKNVEKGTLLTVGRIDLHKGIDKLILTISRLIEKGIDARLEIVGPDSRNLISQLQQKAIDFKVEKKVKFIGKVDDIELTTIFSRAHLFVSASTYEGFGIAAVEAMASGTLCVLNNIPSFSEILDSNKFGRIVNFENTDEVVQNIESLLNISESEYNELSKKARIYAENYNWNKISKKITALYN
jgi:alpha-1,3-mannosyltransferase